MATLLWTASADATYKRLRADAESSVIRRKSGRKASKAEGLFKQIKKALDLLASNARHPGLNTHKYDSIQNPYQKGEPVFEAYAQNQTPGAYRIFWCYGPKRGDITILAITPHP